MQLYIFQSKSLNLICHIISGIIAHLLSKSSEDPSYWKTTPFSSLSSLEVAMQYLREQSIDYNEYTQADLVSSL